MKNVLLGVTGGIAAYKAPNIVSMLMKKGYNVKVIMTENATKLITPIAFETLSRNKVYIDMWEKKSNIEVDHIALADWADIILVAPATYSIVGKVANGIADDMLSTVISASIKPVIFALAMNVNMYENPIIKDNIKKLTKYNYKFIDSDEGFLACNVNAKGRLKKEEDIVDIIIEELEKINTFEIKSLYGKKVLITAGRTEEPLDPIRYFSNRSTGKMGYLLAKVANHLGAEVTLISGPTNLDESFGVKKVQVRTADEMYGETMRYAKDQDVIIATAAVADYRPAHISEKKIKKTDELVVKFIKNKDILFELGKIKNKQILVGFAAESENLLENAKGKLDKKNLDMIIANLIEDSFANDTNKITMIGKDFENSYEKMEKEKVAKIIWEMIIGKLM